jgi:hypothetical protein
MAKLASQADVPAPKPKAEEGGNDLAVLHPDVTCEIGDRTVTVREYRFIDGMRARAIGQPLIDELQAMRDGGRLQDAVLEDYIDMLARHPDVTRTLILDSVEGADADWIDSLSEGDGFSLVAQWWGVCGRFFARILVRRAAERVLHQARRAGATSSASSPREASASPPSSSATTRNVS